MISLMTPGKAQKRLAGNIRLRRLAMDLTQEGLSNRSGVPLPTLRKFEQQGVISLEAFLKLLMVVGGIEDVVSALAPADTTFTSIDDVLKAGTVRSPRKRGRQS